MQLKHKGPVVQPARKYAARMDGEVENGDQSLITVPFRCQVHH
jgi:hypothetical protein